MTGLKFWVGFWARDEHLEVPSILSLLKTKRLDELTKKVKF